MPWRRKIRLSCALGDCYSALTWLASLRQWTPQVAIGGASVPSGGFSSSVCARPAASTGISVGGPIASTTDRRSPASPLPAMERARQPVRLAGISGVRTHRLSRDGGPSD